MKTSMLVVFALVAITSISVSSCKKYSPSCNGDNPTYNTDIKSITNVNCTKSGCHPSFATYNGLKPYLLSDKFATMVLDKQSMPQGGSLTNEELDLLQCWADNGYPEN